jgi:hypothetical protein
MRSAHAVSPCHARIAGGQTHIQRIAVVAPKRGMTSPSFPTACGWGRCPAPSARGGMPVSAWCYLP